jgi:hypothetical protein
MALRPLTYALIRSRGCFVLSKRLFIPEALPFFDISGFDSWQAVMDQWYSHAGDARMHKVAGDHYTVL